ncbi:OmpP1/FadL family transporter [Rufibacter sp. LB8]|uniref:OmpP1/FadL family transporter n=1 Tax=Rufibacter sp. LB8 TaxID=2777781 RepID=UPI00178C3B2F|nr:hypothetical protein [Rufibacter sp. LB8]
MKKYSFLLACLALLGSAGKGFAQTEIDILRYSRTDFGGTARTMGIGGANVGLGGDAGNLYSNPAGLGLFRRSEISVSAGMNFNEVNSTVEGSAGMNNRNNLNIPHFSAVFSTRKADDEEGDWRASNFGISFTRQNNFNQRVFYRGVAGQNSMRFGEYAAQLANADDPTGAHDFTLNSLQELAYETYLLSEDDFGYFLRDVSLTNPYQETIESSGSQNQWDFSYGASFRDKLFLGASIGLSSLKFKQTRTYTETDPAANISNVTLYDNLSTEGTGVNIKIGALFKPVDALRIGVSMQTPTWYTLTDNFRTQLDVNFNTAPEPTLNLFQTFSTDDGVYEYNLTTPFRANGGVAAFIGKYGFVTADMEYVDYSAGKLSAGDYNFQDENMAAKSVYSSAVNYRLGAEARLDVFRLRAGYALYGDPFKNSSVDQAKTYLTGGFGIRQTNYFIDAALVYSKFNSVYSPYVNSDFAVQGSEYEGLTTPEVNSKHENTNFVVTFGWNF